MTSTSKLWETITWEGAAGISYKSFMRWLIWYIYPGDQPWRGALKYVWGDSSISVNVTISNLFFRSTGISKYQTGSYVFLTNKMFYKMFQWMFLQAVVLNICSRRRKRWWKGWKALALSAHATSVFLPHSISYFWAGWQAEFVRNICPNIEMNPIYV